MTIVLMIVLATLSASLGWMNYEMEVQRRLQERERVIDSEEE